MSYTSFLSAYSEAQEKKPLTKRQQKALQTRDNIFHAAMEVINEKGFSNTTIDDITTRANVASGSFYTYYPSKEAIVLETLKRSDDIYEWAFQQTLGEAFSSRIINFIHLSYTEYEKRGKGIIKAIISNYYAFPGNVIYPDDRPLIACIRKIVESGLASGEINSSYSVEDCILQFVSVMAGVEVMWCFDETSKSLSDMMVQAFRTLASGMSARS